MNTCKCDVNSLLKYLSSDQKLKTLSFPYSSLQKKKLQKTDQICHLSFSFNEKSFTHRRYIKKIPNTSVCFLNTFIRQKYPSFVISVISYPLTDKTLTLPPTQLTCKKKKVRQRTLLLKIKNLIFFQVPRTLIIAFQTLFFPTNKRKKTICIFVISRIESGGEMKHYGSKNWQLLIDLSVRTHEK